MRPIIYLGLQLESNTRLLDYICEYSHATEWYGTGGSLSEANRVSSIGHIVTYVFVKRKSLRT